MERSSSNSCSRTDKIPRVRKFLKLSLPGNESSMKTKVLSVDFSLPEMKVVQNKKSVI